MTEAIVQLVEPKGDSAAILVMNDGQRVWTPEKVKADALLGKPIPTEWTIKQGQYGPQAFPPKAKGAGGGGGFRSTKDGQAYEQERMDRRTALMQACAISVDSGTVLRFADDYYKWLRKTSGEPSASRSADVAPPSVGAPAESGPPKLPALLSKGAVPGGAPFGGEEDLGKVPDPAEECSHLTTSETKPDGRPLPPGRSRCVDCGVVL